MNLIIIEFTSITDSCIVNLFSCQEIIGSLYLSPYQLSGFRLITFTHLGIAATTGNQQHKRKDCIQNLFHDFTP